MAGAAFGSALLIPHAYLVNGISIACFLGTIGTAALIPERLGRNSQGSRGEEALLNSINASTPPSSPAASPSASPRLDNMPGSKAEVRSVALTDISLITGDQATISRILIHSWRASIASLITLFAIPNPTRTVIILFFVHSFAISAQILLPQYSSLALHWSLATSNAAVAFKALASAILLLVLPTLRSRFLEPRMSAIAIDLLIIEASVAAGLFGMLGLGLSTTPFTFLLSLCIFTSGQGLLDSLTAYGAATLGPEQTLGDFYLRTGLVQTLAGLIAAPAWSTGFGSVVQGKTLPLGMPFLVVALLCGIAWIGARSLQRRHRDSL